MLPHQFLSFSHQNSRVCKLAFFKICMIEKVTCILPACVLVINMQRSRIHCIFINAGTDVLSGRLLSLEGVIKTFVFLDGAFVGQVARPLRQRLYIFVQGFL